jgi:pimeloyl-ACP methyl ester carboxylesterase
MSNTDFPRVTTRGYYDLHNGKRLSPNDYNLYPKQKFYKIFEKDNEVVIFVHGMRNSRWGAQNSGKILRRTIRKLGYSRKYPVIVFTYDSDVRGAHIDKNYNKTLRVAEKIAKANGKHLATFVEDLKMRNPLIKVHIVGHSLGCDVVASYIENFKYHTDSVHLLGSPVEIRKVIALANCYPVVKLVNYYNLKDDVIKEGVDKGKLKRPSCLDNIKYDSFKNIPCRADNHGFRAYADKLRKFP